MVLKISLENRKCWKKCVPVILSPPFPISVILGSFSKNCFSENVKTGKEELSAVQFFDILYCLRIMWHIVLFEDYVIWVSALTELQSFRIYLYIYIHQQSSVLTSILQPIPTTIWEENCPPVSLKMRVCVINMELINQCIYLHVPCLS